MCKVLAVSMLELDEVSVTTSSMGALAWNCDVAELSCVSALLLMSDMLLSPDL